MLLTLLVTEEGRRRRRSPLVFSYRETNEIFFPERNRTKWMTRIGEGNDRRLREMFARRDGEATNDKFGERNFSEITVGRVYL